MLSAFWICHPVWPPMVTTDVTSSRTSHFDIVRDFNFFKSNSNHILLLLKIKFKFSNSVQIDESNRNRPGRNGWNQNFQEKIMGRVFKVFVFLIWNYKIDHLRLQIFDLEIDGILFCDSHHAQNGVKGKTNQRAHCEENSKIIRLLRCNCVVYL